FMVSNLISSACALTRRTVMGSGVDIGGLLAVKRTVVGGAERISSHLDTVRTSGVGRATRSPI
ncbi:MAG: hypothetical protein V3U33_09010, partial [candidate division NC10 bacterium]